MDYPDEHLAERFRRAKTSDESGLWLDASWLESPDRWVSRKAWLYHQYRARIPKRSEYNAQPWSHLVRLYRQRGEHQNANGILAHQRAVEGDLSAVALSQWMHLGISLGVSGMLIVTAMAGAWSVGMMLSMLSALAAVLVGPLLPERKRDFARLVVGGAAGMIWIFQLAFVAEGLSGGWATALTIGVIASIAVFLLILLLRVDFLAASFGYACGLFLGVLMLLHMPVYTAAVDLLDGLRLLGGSRDEVIELEDPARIAFALCLGLTGTGLLMALARPVTYLLNFLFWLGFRYGLSPTRAMLTVFAMLMLGTFGVNSALKQKMLVLDGAYVTPVTDGVSVGYLSSTEFAAAPAPLCDVFITPAAYAADIFIPLVDLRQEFRCHIDTERRGDTTVDGLSAEAWVALKSLYRLLGWIVVSLTVLTCIGAVRRMLGERMDLA